MADVAGSNYTESLSQALVSRKEWLEKSELTKLKEELRIFQISYSVLYSLFLKKKLINEDPYKQESKITDIVVPDGSAFNEAKRHEQLSLRLASYDSQLDFLVNFLQFSVDNLGLDRIRKIVGLIRYIDWVNLSPDSQAPNTGAVASITNHSKSGADNITLSVIGESLTKLSKCTASIMGILRDISIYHKEIYKLSVREAVKGSSASDMTVLNIKKKLSVAMPGKPFFQEYIDEVIKEDFTKDGPTIREAVLKSLHVAEDKPKTAKPKVDYKGILLDGIYAIGAAANVMSEIAQKITDNETVLANRKKGFWEKFQLFIKAMMNSAPDELIIELEVIDQTTGLHKREDLNFNQFRVDLEKRIKILMGMSGQGTVISKLAAMNEEQIMGYLERTIKDVQNFHRTLTALDDYFKTAVPREDRNKIKGIKPELASVKNCTVRANQIRHQYSAQKEEEEQLKRLGINPGS